MAKVPNAIEILLKISTTLVGCTSVTDRQTDRQATAKSKRELEFTFAKNLITVAPDIIDSRDKIWAPNTKMDHTISGFV